VTSLLSKKREEVERIRDIEIIDKEAVKKVLLKLNQKI